MRSSPVVIGALIIMVVAIAHLFRLFYGFDIEIGSYQVPMWMSVAGYLGLGTLSAWLFRSLNDFI